MLKRSLTWTTVLWYVFVSSSVCISFRSTNALLIVHSLNAFKQWSTIWSCRLNVLSVRSRFSRLFFLYRNQLWKSVICLIAFLNETIVELNYLIQCSFIDSFVTNHWTNALNKDLFICKANRNHSGWFVLCWNYGEVFWLGWMFV